MSEAAAHETAGAPAPSAGSLLREARLARGLQIAELAASLKVAPRQLELLESDRLEQLHNAAFVRALAQTLCRSLKTDPAPVLALLPQAAMHRLDQLNEGLNAPFRDRPGQVLPEDWSGLAKPLIWGPVLILLAALALYFFPTGFMTPAKVSARAASAPQEAGTVAAIADADTVAIAVPLPAGPAGSTAPAMTTVDGAAAAPEPVAGSAAAEVAPVRGVLQLHASKESWIEVFDGRGSMLLSRPLQAGEAVGLDGAMPLKVIVGNVTGTQVVFRGKAMDLSSFTRGNVARFELN
jgi:cytoskeleton protein RodZ